MKGLEYRKTMRIYDVFRIEKIMQSTFDFFNFQVYPALRAPRVRKKKTSPCREKNQSLRLSNDIVPKLSIARTIDFECIQRIYGSL